MFPANVELTAVRPPSVITALLVTVSTTCRFLINVTPPSSSKLGARKFAVDTPRYTVLLTARASAWRMTTVPSRIDVMPE
jgi:hypothetical protein